MKSFFKTNGLWLALFMATALIFILLILLVRPEAVESYGLFFVLLSLFMVAVGCAAAARRKKRTLDALDAFIDDPCEETKNRLLSVCDGAAGKLCEYSLEKIQEQAYALNEKQVSLQNYREYIEAWTHEIKTPLSLMTLVLENHPEEMSEAVADRVGYATLQIGQVVERIMYYARLQTDHVDYNYSRFRLDECVREVIKSYAPLAEERKAKIALDAQPLEVVSDSKILAFMISQLVGNAVKYCAAVDGRVTVSIFRRDGRICLAVRDNGNGVPAEDLPFIFDKGFTGDHPDRQKATGMGLYLASKYAAALNIELLPEQNSPAQSGFGIDLLFPVVE